jgi:hypothetical protein
MVLPARKITRPRVLCSNFKLNAMNNTAFMKKLFRWFHDDDFRHFWLSFKFRLVIFVVFKKIFKFFTGVFIEILPYI